MAESSSDPVDDFLSGGGEDDTTYSQRRLPERTYASKSFGLYRPGSQDNGKPARYVRKVFDASGETTVIDSGSEWLVSESPRGRTQLKFLIAGEPGNVKELWIQRVPPPGSSGKNETVLNLRDDDAIRRLITFIKNLDVIPVEGAQTIRIDDALLRDIFDDPYAVASVYRQDRELFRDIISSDVAASDVVAVAHRRAQVERFRRMLDDDDYFDSEKAQAGGKEKAWQRLFEANPWILGGSLAGQFLTSWSKAKLEQTVAGWDIGGEGRRADAVFRSAGRVRSMVLAEIKHHRTRLLDSDYYRKGCWAPSDELAGGVVQAQATAHQAARDLGERLATPDDDGSDIPGDYTYLFRPRSFLVVGRLTELLGEAGGDHQQKIRSFELFRRHLASPEVLTFDEVLSRAEWLVGGGELSPYPGPP